MSNNYNRTQRVADLVHRELAWVLQRQMADPRLQHLTIMAVKVSKDFAYADIAITQFSEHINTSTVLAALKKATPRLRACLAQKLALRVTPALRFIYDTSTEQCARLHTRIDQIVGQDADKHREC